MSHIATDAVRKQLKKVLDRGNRREKAERVRKTLQDIKQRTLSGESMKKELEIPECKFKKPTTAKAVGYSILVEMLTEAEASGSIVMTSQAPSQQAWVRDIGPLVNKDSGLKKGDRVLLQGQYVPLPVKSAEGRLLGTVDLPNIKAILEE